MSIRESLRIDEHFDKWLKQPCPRPVLLIEGTYGIGKSTWVQRILAKQCTELVYIDGNCDCGVDANRLPVVALSTRASREQFLYFMASKPRDGRTVVVIDDADQLLVDGSVNSQLNNRTDLIKQLQMHGPPLVLVSSDNFKSPVLRAIQGTKLVQRARLYPPKESLVERLLIEQTDIVAQPSLAHRIACETAGDVRRALLQYRLEALGPPSIHSAPVFAEMREGGQVFEKLGSLLGTTKSRKLGNDFCETSQLCSMGGTADQQSLLRLYRGYYLHSVPFMKTHTKRKPATEIEQAAMELEGLELLESMSSIQSQSCHLEDQHDISIALDVGCIGPARVLDTERTVRRFATPAIAYKGNGLDGKEAKSGTVTQKQRIPLVQSAFRCSLAEVESQKRSLTSVCYVEQHTKRRKPNDISDELAVRYTDDYKNAETHIAEHMSEKCANRLIFRQYDRLFYQSRILAHTKQHAGFAASSADAFAPYTVGKQLLAHITKPLVVHQSQAMSKVNWSK